MFDVFIIDYTVKNKIRISVLDHGLKSKLKTRHLIILLSYHWTLRISRDIAQINLIHNVIVVYLKMEIQEVKEKDLR